MFQILLAFLLIGLTVVTSFAQTKTMPSMPTGPKPVTTPVPINAPVPPFDITADQETTFINQQTGPGQKNFRFTAVGNVQIKGGDEFNLSADRVEGDFATGVGTATGHVNLREIDTSLKASQLFYDQREGIGQFYNATLIVPPYYIQADDIQLFANKIIAKNANISTCSPDEPQDFHFQMRKVEYLLIKREADLKDAGLYIGRSRVFHINKLNLIPPKPTDPAGSQSNQGLRRTAGYDSHRGLYAVVGAYSKVGPLPVALNMLVPTRSQFSIAATTAVSIPLRRPSQDDSDVEGHKSLIALIRKFASVAGYPLPIGDPLLFHDFLNNNPLDTVFKAPIDPALVPNATASFRVPVYGRRISALSYSQLPELATHISFPIYGDIPLPTDRNPHDIRAALRKLSLFGDANLSEGYYQEQPTNVKSGRTAAQMTFDTRPLLIGNNVLFRPRVTLFAAHYTAINRAYHYAQYDLAFQHSVTDKVAVGAEYIVTSQAGYDPFVFDSVDTNQELDLRGQIGNDRRIFGIHMKIDQLHWHLYDTQFVYGFSRRCYIPTITYERPSGAIGVGFNIPGVTF